jgi:hypothetical protein
MKAWRIIVAVFAAIGGLLLLFAASGDNAGVELFFGCALLAGGLTYWWKLSGFRGLKARESTTEK